MCRQDAKISSMERGLRELEEEVNMLKSNGALSSEEREEEIKQMEVYRSHSKFMKNKVMDARARARAQAHTYFCLAVDCFSCFSCFFMLGNRTITLFNCNDCVQ